MSHLHRIWPSIRRNAYFFFFKMKHMCRTWPMVQRKCLICVAPLAMCDAHFMVLGMELGAGINNVRRTIYRVRRKYATICVARHTTQIMSGLSASRPLASDQCATQIGASHPTQIALSVLVSLFFKLVHSIEQYFFPTIYSKLYKAKFWNEGPV